MNKSSSEIHSECQESQRIPTSPVSAADGIKTGEFPEFAQKVLQISYRPRAHVATCNCYQ